MLQSSQYSYYQAIIPENIFISNVHEDTIRIYAYTKHQTKEDSGQAKRDIEISKAETRWMFTILPACRLGVFMPSFSAFDSRLFAFLGDADIFRGYFFL